MALTKRYVRADASGSGDGTTDSASGGTGAFTWAQFITDINTPRAGYKYIIMSIGGAFANGTTTTTLTGDGTTTSPNVIEGCYQTEGDLNDQGRSAGGALDTTNFPQISYTGTTARFVASGADYIAIRLLSITSAASNPTVLLSSTHQEIRRCVVTNTGTNSLSSAINVTGTGGTAEDCDTSTATTGATYAINLAGNESKVVGCRVKCVSGAGISITGGARCYAFNNTIFECTNGIETTGTTMTSDIRNNTIANCTGNGVEIITGTTTVVTIKNNHITGCGGWGINFNTSTCVKKLGNNRLRDNGSGPVTGGGDWEEGTSVNNVTSNDTDADDFTDQSNDDYSLLTTAAAITSGIGYRNPIGAHGAGSFPSGGGMIGGGNLNGGFQ